MQLWVAVLWPLQQKRANVALTYTQQLPEQQYPMVIPRDCSAETGNKLQSYCECWSRGQTETDGIEEIHLANTLIYVQT